MANTEERGERQRPEPMNSSAESGFRGAQHSTNNAQTPVNVNATRRVSDAANMMIPQWSCNMMSLPVKPQLSPIIIDQRIAEKYKYCRAAHIGIYEQPRTESPSENSTELPLGSGNGNAPTSEMVRPPTTSTPLLRPPPSLIPAFVLPDATASRGNISQSPSLLHLDRTFQTVVNLHCPFPSNYIYPMYDHFINGVVPSYSCMFCLFRCTDQSTMEGHIRLHIDKNIPYICGLCNLGFDQLDTLEQHLNQHVYEILKCGKCDFECLPVLDMIAHMLKHRNMMRRSQDEFKVCNNNVTPSSDEQIQFACDECDCVYANQAQLIQHARESHNLTDSSQICCIFCGFKTSRRRDLDIHIRKHYMRRSFYCAVCEYQCAELRQMDAHIKQHTNWNMLVCKCGYKTNDAQAFEKHLTTNGNLHEQREMGYASFFRGSCNDEDYDVNEEDYADEKNIFPNKSMRTRPLGKNMKVVEKRFYSGGDIWMMVDRSGGIENNLWSSAKGADSRSRNAESDVDNIDSRPTKTPEKTANNVDKYSKNTADNTIKKPDNRSDQAAENTDNIAKSSNIIGNNNTNTCENTANCSSITAESSSNTANTKNIANSSYITDNNTKTSDIAKTSNETTICNEKTANSSKITAESSSNTVNTKNIANSSYITDNTKNSDIAKTSNETTICNEKTAENTVGIMSNSGEDEKTATTSNQKFSHPNEIVEAVKENNQDITIVYENVVQFVAITGGAIVSDGNNTPNNGDLGKEGTNDTKNKIHGAVNKVDGYEKTINNTVVDLSITDGNYANVTMKNSYKIIDENIYVVEIENLGDEDKQEQKNTDGIIEIEENDDCKMGEGSNKYYEKNTNEVEIEENMNSDVDNKINKENQNLDENIEAIINDIGIEVIISNNPDHIEKTIDEIRIDYDNDCKLGEKSAVNNNFDRGINYVEIEANDNTSSNMTCDNDNHVDKSMNGVLVEANIEKNIKDTKVEANMDDNNHVKESQKNKYDDSFLEIKPCSNDDHVGRIFDENIDVFEVVVSKEKHADDSMKGFHKENFDLIEFGANNDCEDVEESVKNVVVSDKKNADGFELKRDIGSQKCAKNPRDVEVKTDNVVEHVEQSIEGFVKASNSNFDAKNTRTSSDRTMECFQNKMEDINTEASYNDVKHDDREGETFQKNMNKNVVATESEKTQGMNTGRERVTSGVTHFNKHTDLHEIVTSNIEHTDINNLRIMVNIDLNKLIKLGTIEADMNRTRFSVKIPSINVCGDIVAETGSTSGEYSSQARIEGGGILSVNTGKEPLRQYLGEPTKRNVPKTPKKNPGRVVDISKMKSGETIVDNIANQNNLVKTLVTDFEKSATNNVVKYENDKSKNSSTTDFLELATRNYEKSVECRAEASLISNFDKSSMKFSATGRNSQENSSFTKYVSKNENLAKHGARRSFAGKSFTEKLAENVNLAKHGAEKKSSTHFDNTSMIGVVNTKSSTILGRKRACSFENDSDWKRMRYCGTKNFFDTPVKIDFRRLSVDTVEQVRKRYAEMSQNNNACEGTRKKYHVANTARKLKQRDDEMSSSEDLKKFSQKTAINYIFKSAQRKAKYLAALKIREQKEMKANFSTNSPIPWKRAKEDMSMNCGADCSFCKYEKEVKQLNFNESSKTIEEDEVIEESNQENGVNSSKPSPGIIFQSENGEFVMEYTGETDVLIRNETTWRYEGVTKNTISSVDDARQPSIFDKMFPENFGNTKSYAYVTFTTDSGKFITKSAGQCKEAGVDDHSHDNDLPNSSIENRPLNQERTATFLCTLPYKTVIPSSIKIVRKETDNNSEWIIILY